MKQVTLLLWLFVGQCSFAQSLQISVEAGLHRHRNFGGAQVGRYALDVRTPVTSDLGAVGYTVGIYGRIMTKSPFFFQAGIRHSGQETGVRYTDTQPGLPTTEDDIDISYAGNYLYRFDVPILVGLGGQLGSKIRLEVYAGILPTLNKYKYTGDYDARFSWTAQIIDQSLKPLSWSYLYGTTLWLKRWGITLAREANLSSLHRNITYKGGQYPFSFGYRSTRLSVSYRFGKRAANTH